MPAGKFRWVTLGSDAQPGLEIVLSVPHAGRSPADGYALQELLTKRVLPVLVFCAGADVLQEPIDQPWCPSDRAFRDPSGNTVRIAQAPATWTVEHGSVQNPFGYQERSCMAS